MSRKLFGLVLVLVGAVVILNRLDMLRHPIHLYWPLWLLVIGVALHVAFFVSPDSRRSGLLMPAGILTVLGIVFFLQRLPGLYHIVLWPLILFAPAAGFLETYAFGRREWGMLMSGLILIAIAVISYVNLFVMLNGAVLLGVAFMAVGVYLVVRPLVSNRDRK